MNKLLLTSSSTNNFQVSTPTTTAFADQEYTAPYTGSGTFALMAQETFFHKCIVDEFKFIRRYANNAMNIIRVLKQQLTILILMR
jgi:hypothetical protein